MHKTHLTCEQETFDKSYDHKVVHSYEQQVSQTTLRSQPLSPCYSCSGSEVEWSTEGHCLPMIVRMPAHEPNPGGNTVTRGVPCRNPGLMAVPPHPGCCRPMHASQITGVTNLNNCSNFGHYGRDVISPHFTYGLF